MSKGESKSQVSFPSPPKSKSNSTRLIVLLVLFGIAIAALAYDYKVARPKTHEGYEAIQSLLNQRHEGGIGKGQVGPDQVKEKLGRAPYSKSEKNDFLIEKYVWRSGLPFRTFYINVLYKGDKKILTNVFENEEVGEEHTAKPFTEVDPATAEPARSPQAMGLGAGGQKKSVTVPIPGANSPPEGDEGNKSEAQKSDSAPDKSADSPGKTEGNPPKSEEKSTEEKKPDEKKPDENS